MLSLIKNIIQEMLNDKYPEHKDINFNVSFIENKDFGDIACNIAMILAKKVNIDPKVLAQSMIDYIQNSDLTSIADYIKNNIQNDNNVQNDNNLQDNNYVKDNNINNKNIFAFIQFAGAGFINFGFSNIFFKYELLKINKKNANVNWEELQSAKWNNKKIILEHTSPNLLKPINIGLIMNNIVGESVYQLLKEGVGKDGKITVISFPSDKSIGIAKAIYYMKKFNQDLADKIIKTEEGICEDIKNKTFNNEYWNLNILDDLGKMYSEGVKYYDENPEEHNNIKKVSDIIFSLDSKNILNDKSDNDVKYYSLLYKSIKNINVSNLRDWISRKLSSHITNFIYESEAGIRGKELILNVLYNNKNSIFKKDLDSETIYYDTNIKKNNNTEETFKSVFINSEGHPTYEAKDLGLLYKKFEYIKGPDYAHIDNNIPIDTIIVDIQDAVLFNPDFNIFVTDVEQTQHFKVVLEVAKKIADFEDNADLKTFLQNSIHIPHGRMTLRGEKMSSRLGNAMTGDEIFDLIKEKIRKNTDIENSEISADYITNSKVLAFLKVLVLKNKFGINIDLNPERDITSHGATGFYLLWSYSRGLSLLKKYNLDKKDEDIVLNDNHIALIKKILEYEYHYKKAIDGLESHLIISYLFELSKAFNSFYDKEKKISESYTGVAVIKAYMIVLFKGLRLVKIDVVEKM